jgi:tripartite-type tricarboxylate transporter receptor subunit TctC
MGMIKNGQLKALAIMSAKRMSEIPDVPSISEFASGCEFIGFTGLLAPAKTPPGILSKLNSAISKGMKTSQMREQMASLGSEAIGSSQEDLVLHISSEMERWQEAIKLLERAPGTQH